MRSSRILAYLVAAPLILAVFAWAFGWPGGGRITAETPVAKPERMAAGPTVEAVLETVVPVTEAVGTVQAREKASVSSELLAVVRAVRVSAGDRVEAGDLLVELDDRDERTRVQQAEETVNAAQAALEDARREVGRAEDLYRERAGTERDVDQTRTRLTVATAELARAKEALNQAKVALSLTRIHAPVAGIVVDKLVDAGDLASPGKPLLNIYNPGLLRLEVDVRSALLPRVHVGDTVRVHIDDIDTTLDGAIGEIVPTADVASRSVRVKVDLPAEPRLYVGMFGRLRIPLDPQEVLLVPRDAVSEVGQLHMVDVVDHGRLRRRLVTLGEAYGDRVHVLSGLQAGERVARP